MADRLMYEKRLQLDFQACVRVHTSEKINNGGWRIGRDHVQTNDIVKQDVMS